MIKKLIQKIKDGTATQILNELRWINGYSKRYWWAIGWYIFLGILGMVITLGSSVVSKDIVDIVTGYQKGLVVQTAIIYVAMQLLAIIIKAFASRVSAKVQIRVSQGLRADIFQKILLAQFEPLSEFHSGDLLSRSSRDTDVVAGSIMSWGPSLIVNSLQFVGIFVLLFWFDKTLALLALATAPITLIVSFFLVKQVRKYSKKMREIGSESSSFHAETFRNIRFIKAFYAVDTFCDKLNYIQQKQKEAVLEHNRFSVLTSSFMSFVGVVISGVCFLWSAYRLWGGHITFGEMMLFLQLSGGLAGAFSALVSLVPSAVTAATSAGRIMEITELPAEESENVSQVESLLKHGKISIKANDLTFSYKSGKNVFSGANFRADAGEVVALVGPSGCGKTTMLRLLLGMMPLQSGNIKLYNKNSATELIASPSTRRLFSYFPQDNTLFSGTIADNLRLANKGATDEMLESALKTACAYDFVSALPGGINAIVGENGDKLSKGQVQRITIARALLSDAPILLLDEATSALDVKTEQTLLENIMKDAKGRTCILTTHRPSVLSICKRVYCIQNLNIEPIEKDQLSNLLKDFK